MDQAKLAKMQQSVRIGESQFFRVSSYAVSVYGPQAYIEYELPLTSMGFRVSNSSSKEGHFLRLWAGLFPRDIADLTLRLQR